MHPLQDWQVRARAEWTAAELFLARAPRNASGFVGVGTVPVFDPLVYEASPSLAPNVLQNAAVQDTPQGIAWSPDNQFVAVIIGASPFIVVYQVDASGRIVAQVANPGTVPAGIPVQVRWSPSGADIAVVHATTPFVTAYPWTTAGFGAKYANPVALPAGAGQSVWWSPDGLYLGVGHTTTPFASVYNWSAGFGAKVANPAALPPAQADYIYWTPAGTDIFVCSATSPFLSCWPWAAGWGAKYADSAASFAAKWVRVLGDGITLLTVMNVSPFMHQGTLTHGTSYTTTLNNIATPPSSQTRQPDIDADLHGIWIERAGPPPVIWLWSASWATTPSTMQKITQPAASFFVADGVQQNAMACISPNRRFVAASIQWSPWVRVYAWNRLQLAG